MAKTTTYIAESKRYAIDIPLFEDVKFIYKPLYVTNHYGEPKFGSNGLKIALSKRVAASPDTLKFDKNKGYRCVFNLTDEEQCMKVYGVHYAILKRTLDKCVKAGNDPLRSADYIKRKDNPAEYEANLKLEETKSIISEKDSTIDTMRKELELLKKKK